MSLLCHELQLTLINTLNESNLHIIMSHALDLVIFTFPVSENFTCLPGFTKCVNESKCIPSADLCETASCNPQLYNEMCSKCLGVNTIGFWYRGGAKKVSVILKHCF